MAEPTLLAVLNSIPPYEAIANTDEYSGFVEALDAYTTADQKQDKAEAAYQRARRETQRREAALRDSAKRLKEAYEASRAD